MSRHIITPEMLASHAAFLRGEPGGVRLAVPDGAVLSGADLTGAVLSRAYLTGADLTGANLSGAVLARARLPSPPAVLLAFWGDISPSLCRDLMEYDAANCPGGLDAFDAWAASADGPCPYSGAKVERAANFAERREHWDSAHARATAPRSALSLMIDVIREKCAGSDYHGGKP